MKKNMLIIAALIAMSSCNNKKAMPNSTTDIDSQTSDRQFTDSTLAVEFSSNDIDWKNKRMTCTVYSEDLYDSAWVNKLKVGDTLMYEGKPMRVKSIRNDRGTIEINGGVEQGGAWLTTIHGGAWPDKEKNGMYRAVTMDAHSVYTKQRQMTLPLSDQLTLIDCGNSPHDQPDTFRTELQLHFESLPNYRQSFSPINTRITLDKGQVKVIDRRWIP